MKLRTVLVILAVIFLIGIFSMAGAFAVSDYAYLVEVSSTSYLPATIYSGDVVSVAIDIKNLAYYINIVDLNISLDLGEQFELVDDGGTIELIKPGSTKTIVPKFRVSEGTVPGYYPVAVMFEYLRDGVKVTERYSITVPVSEAGKTIDLGVEPQVMNPGSPTELIFSLKNTGKTPLSNISLAWTEENSLVLPLGSDNRKQIDLIGAGETESVSYIASADPNISTGIYPLTVTITYTDSGGQQTQESEVGLLVGGITEFEVSGELSSGQLAVSIANIGSNNAEAVVVKIPSAKGVRVTGSSVDILGNLNRGDYTLATFELSMTSVPSAEDGESPRMQQASSIPVVVEYTDTTGKRQSVSKEISLAPGITATSETAASGESQFPAGGFRTRQSAQAGSDGTLPWIALGLICALAGVFNWKKAKKDWVELGKIIAGIVVIFLLAIVLFGSGIIAIAIASFVSIALLLAFFFKPSLLETAKKKAIKIKNKLLKKLGR